MVMKKGTKKTPQAARRPEAPVRIGVADAKLSRALRSAGETPTIIHNRGRDVAVLLGVAEYERLVANDDAKASAMSALLRDIEALKLRFGGGADPGAEPLAYVGACVARA